MTEPLLQADGQQDDARLWDKAPAWRTLTVTASLLTLAAVATPLLLPQQTAPARPVVTANAGKILLPQTPPVQPTPTPAQLALAPAPPASTAAPVRHHAVAAPAALQPPQTQSVCRLAMNPIAPHPMGMGTVISFEDRAVSQARIKLTEATSGGLIDPDFIDNQRVVVQNGNGQVRIFILPKGLSVRVGDRVTVQTGYRNAALPCNYVPIQIASDIGPPPLPPAPPIAQDAPAQSVAASPSAPASP